MSRYYDRKGQPLADVQAWGILFEDRSYQSLGVTDIGDVRVSTVWLGIDHSHGEGPPIIFETMVFGGPLDGHQSRYVTEAEALAGHDEVVAEVIAEGS